MYVWPTTCANTIIKDKHMVTISRYSISVAVCDSDTDHLVALCTLNQHWQSFCVTYVPVTGHGCVSFNTRTFHAVEIIISPAERAGLMSLLFEPLTGRPLPRYYSRDVAKMVRESPCSSRGVHCLQSRTGPQREDLSLHRCDTFHLTNPDAALSSYFPDNPFTAAHRLWPNWEVALVAIFGENMY